MKALVYDIDTEGWLQFERLIESCLLIDDIEREGRLYVANSVRGLVPAKHVSD